MRIVGILLSAVLICAALTVTINVRFLTQASEGNRAYLGRNGVNSEWNDSTEAGQSVVKNFNSVQKKEKARPPTKARKPLHVLKRKKSANHTLTELSCEAHGGPAGEIATEMVYWKEIPSDLEYISPYDNYGPKVKYLTVEPDEGFWNNKRMAMESAVVLAVATGRVLVLPPRQDFVYEEIFHFDSIVKKSSLQVITTQEFLTREALSGNLKDAQGHVMYPPENKRVNWDGDMRLWWDGNVLWPYLRQVTKPIMWEKDRCVAVIPDQPGPEGEARIQGYLEKILSEHMHEEIRVESYTGNPTPVDSPPLARLREIIASRKEVCVYNDEMQNAKYLHAMGDNGSMARFFSHFYTFLFFEDWRQDLFVKRFIRDHFRYVDSLQCAAARIVSELRDVSMAKGNQEGAFDTFHVRRGDFLNFQTSARVDGEQIYKNTHSVLEEGSTIYVATDESQRKFFEPLKKHYDLYFLDDFQHLLHGIPLSNFGMLDQLVASMGRTFVGLYYSTFTGYINRMRAYHAQKNEVLGYDDGVVPSYFYAPRQFKYSLQQYRSVSSPYWKTEFPTAWRDIDFNVLS